MTEGQAYGDAVEELRHASGGRYAGPGIRPQEIKQALGGAAGIDPGAIGQHLGFAVGVTDTSRLGKGWLGGLLQVLQHLAFGLIGDALGKGIREWWQNREDAQQLTHEAEKAAEAMRDICATSDTAASEILAALSQNVTALSNHLRCLAPQAGPEQAAAFNSALGMAASVIDQAGSSVMELCRERDGALAGCMEELERRVSTVCEAPQPCGPAAVEPARAERSCPPVERETPSAGVSPTPPAPPPDVPPGNGSGAAPGVEVAAAGPERTPVGQPETACPEPRLAPAAASEEASPAASGEAEPQTRHAAREEGCSVPPRGERPNTSPTPAGSTHCAPVSPAQAGPSPAPPSPVSPAQVTTEAVSCGERQPCGMEGIVGSLAGAGAAGMETILNGARLGAEIVGGAVEGIAQVVESAVPPADGPPPCPPQASDTLCESPAVSSEQTEQPIPPVPDTLGSTRENAECVEEAPPRPAPPEPDSCPPQEPSSPEPPTTPEPPCESPDPAGTEPAEPQQGAPIDPGVDLASVPEPEPPAEKLAHLGQPSEHSPEQASVGEEPPASPPGGDPPEHMLVGEADLGVSPADAAADTDNAEGVGDAGAREQGDPDGGNGQQEERPGTVGARKAGTW
ncbi:hypothetical protein [Corynebacterium mastitidis]|uniref:hypothetical protein n=1 Tax=Corynebacterium mastitidis TaxID=161890 RepID=UPI0012EAE765|nr:hypothetical protein [Corynebacterium mastitidis]